MIAKASPLGGESFGTIGTVLMREVPGIPVFDLRVAPGSASQAAVSNALSLALPATTGHVSSAADSEVHSLCTAPDGWLIVGSGEAGNKLAAFRATGEYHFSVVDVSGQRTAVDVVGPKAAEVLSHLWEQDLREKSFPAGRVSQGLMVKAPVIVWHVALNHYRVLVRSSFAVHFWQALTDAAVEHC
ncbi:MAG: sarcosine oxidase subunit gamma [Bacteroidota bacterium]